MLAAQLLTPLVDPKEYSSCTSLELTNPSAFAESRILFFATLLNGVWVAFTYYPEGSHVGFGYPFYELIPSPLEASFSPQRSWVSLFRALLPSDGRSGRFQPPFFALALSQKTSRPCNCASATYSHRKSRIPFASRGFSSGRNLLLS